LEAVYLFNIAHRHAEWATVRQATISGNVANANTPGYAARDIEPFASVLDKTRLTMAQTAAGHLDLQGAEMRSATASAAESWDVHHSGNSVSLDQELLKAAETNGAFSLTTSTIKAFHRMMMTSVRSSG
jgi:flagellar basal-body rod protein FlgB